MRRTRSMLAVLGIVCALSGITGCSNRNGNTSATSGSESNMQNGNKAAGTRARKASLEIEKAMKEFRKASLEASKK